jgi:hypothetical protein
VRENSEHMNSPFGALERGPDGPGFRSPEKGRVGESRNARKAGVRNCSESALAVALPAQ